MKRLLLISSLILLAAFQAGAQGPSVPLRKDSKPMEILHYVVVDGDTVFVDTIQPAWVFPRGSRYNSREWRKYARLVYNFNKVYPYALMAGKILDKVDADIEDQHLKRGKKDRYINSVQHDLLKEFEPVIRKMTISQGQLMVRLLDRELGMTGYTLIRDYKSRFAAGFWQGLAKLFKQDLKSRYDPDGIDKQTEELVQIWQRGDWDNFYFSIFFEPPKKTVIPEQWQ